MGEPGLERVRRGGGPDVLMMLVLALSVLSSLQAIRSASGVGTRWLFGLVLVAALAGIVWILLVRWPYALTVTDLGVTARRGALPKRELGWDDIGEISAPQGPSGYLLIVLATGEELPTRLGAGPHRDLLVHWGRLSAVRRDALDPEADRA